MKLLIDYNLNDVLNAILSFIAACQDPLSEAHPVKPSPPTPSETNADFFSSLLPNPVDFGTLLEPTTTIISDLANVHQTNDLVSVLLTNNLTNVTTASPTGATSTPIPTTIVPLTTPAPAEDIALCPVVDPLSVNYFNGSVAKEFFSNQINLTEMLYYPSRDEPFIATFKLGVDDLGGTIELYSNVIDIPSLVIYFFF